MQKTKLNYHWGNFMTSNYGINDIVEMKNNMHVEQIGLKSSVWVQTFALNAKTVKEVL